LERANIENIYAEKLTFENKKRLLAAIAHHMMDNGDNNLNYQIEYHKLTSFTVDYFKKRFHVDSSKIIENLIKRGIFAKKGEYVSFKASWVQYDF